MQELRVSSLMEIREVLSKLKNAGAFSDSPRLWFWADENLGSLSPSHGRTEANELSSAVEKESQLIEEHQKTDSEDRPLYRYGEKVISFDEDKESFISVDGSGEEKVIDHVSQREIQPVFSDREAYVKDRKEILNQEKEVSLVTTPKEVFFKEVDISGLDDRIDLTALNPILEE